MKYPSPNTLSQVDFLRLVAQKANFTIADTRFLFSKVEEVFTECVQTKTEVYLGALGHLHYTTMKERTLPDPNDNGKLVTRPESIRPLLSLPMFIKQIVRVRNGVLPWKQKRLPNIESENDLGDNDESN